MEYSISEIRDKCHTKEILIGAQLYLKRFYGSLGFIQEGEMYLEDNIEHIKMRLS
jgi:ElaA protein